MAIVDSIMSALGLEKEHPTYECVHCGTTFESAGNPDGPWFKCPECDSENPLGEEGG